ncbi:MAG: metallophosphoesterase [Candidatus Pacearchaeota archaeon]|nr:metallophosphoesterase [Candidatus Pacearchaeota archaeon]
MEEIINEEEGTKIKFVGKCLLIEKLKNLNKKRKKIERVLVVGDLHLGFGEIIGIFGINVGREMFNNIIDEMSEVFRKIGKVDKVILLGDIKHDFGGILRQEWSDVIKMIDYLKEKCKKIILIKGNHDNFLKKIVRKRNLKIYNYYFYEGFFFCHGERDYKKIWDKKVKYLIVGHGHPAIKLKEKKGNKVEKYKCFLVGKIRGKKIIIIPSFAEYYVGSEPREGEIILAWNINFLNFVVYVVGENLEVLNFGLLKNL